MKRKVKRTPFEPMKTKYDPFVQMYACLMLRKSTYGASDADVVRAIRVLKCSEKEFLAAADQYIAEGCGISG